MQSNTNITSGTFLDIDSSIHSSIDMDKKNLKKKKKVTWYNSIRHKGTTKQLRVRPHEKLRQMCSDSPNRPWNHTNNSMNHWWNESAGWVRNSAHFFFQNSPRISESKKHTVIISMKAWETRPNLDWCNWAISIDRIKLTFSGLLTAWKKLSKCNSLAMTHYTVISIYTF